MNELLQQVRFVVCGTALFLATGYSLSTVAAPPPAPDDIDSWIEGLQSGQNAVREWATQKLLEGGVDVIDPLARSIAKLDLESSIRGLDVLRQLALDEITISSRAEQAIRKLAENQIASSSSRAGEVLRSIADVREKRAERILERLGVDFSATAVSMGTYSFSVPVVRTLTFGKRWGGTSADLAFLTWLAHERGLAVEASGPLIDDDWLRNLAQVENLISLKLGRCSVSDDGMAAVQQMKSLRDLRIHYADLSDAWLKHLDFEESSLVSLSVFGSRITRKGVAMLAQKRPQLVTRYGLGGFLGIKGQKNRNGGEGCYVTEVTPNAAANKADVRPGDLIVEYDGKLVTDFMPAELQPQMQPVIPIELPNKSIRGEDTEPSSLAELIGRNRAGDRVNIRIKRRNRYLTKEVVLGEWP